MGLIDLAVLLIFVHGPQNQEIEIVVHNISSIREIRPGTKEHFASGVRCLLLMTNSRQILTTESCAEVIELIKKASK